MIGDTSDAITLGASVANDSRKIGKEFRAQGRVQNRDTIFRTEDHMNQDERERLWHGADYRPGLQPSHSFHHESWGVAPCWYSVAPSALSILIALALTFSLGCNSTPPPTPTRKPAQATTPPRPTVAPPTFKVFHQTADTITLVTKETATDEEVKAILWQLRDAAHAHTFDKLKIGQKAVDAGAPTVWFHIYRGAKCASEKYADGAPPCGASYHAAGDYTYGGGTANPQWDKGVLHHGEDQETPLWNSETPYVAPPPTS